MEIATDIVLAYHIVWTTYGTWLPGDWRGWVKKCISGIQPPDTKREQAARDRMVETEVLLTPEQRAIVERTVTDHCRIRRWTLTLHAVNARTNHVHVVVTANCDPDVARDQFKAWCSRKLSDAVSLTIAVAKKAGRGHRFTEGGDAEIIGDTEYLANAIRYVIDGQ
jgi:hypothetical protein